jgi:acyl-CoA synthetase (AMP-forming)/AMP-acid ligase II
MKPGFLFTWPLTRYKDHTAIVFKDKRLTFSQMDAAINRLSNGLLALGLSKGSKVAALMNNSVESATSLFAIPRAGLAYVSLNARHSPREHAEVLNDAEADALIVDEAFLDLLEPVLPSVLSLKHAIVVGTPRSGRFTYDDLVADQPDSAPDVEVDEDADIERLQYTSGTTGRPKGVSWTFRIGYNVLANVLMNLDQPIGPSDVNLNSGPLTHAAGLMMMTYYSRGATNIILPRYDEQEVLETIERERVTSLLLIPTMLYRLLMVPNLKSFDLTSVRRIWYGTAPMAVKKLTEAIKVFGNVFRQNYGMTEMAQPITYLGPEDHVIHGTESQARRLSSAGRPAMGVEVKVVDEDGQPVDPGRVGEILIRSDKLMKGYWKKPEETAEAFKDGWFHTRDMAMVDEDGYLYIMDRKSDMIISGGFNIYPREVEDVLLSHPGVAEAAVIGVPHEMWGEAVKAMVVLKKGMNVSEAEIIEHCKRDLASYKKPTSVGFIKEIPKNLYGKVNRRTLKEPFWKGHDRWVH